VAEVTIGGVISIYDAAYGIAAVILGAVSILVFSVYMAPIRQRDESRAKIREISAPQKPKLRVTGVHKWIASDATHVRVSVKNESDTVLNEVMTRLTDAIADNSSYMQLIGSDIRMPIYTNGRYEARIKNGHGMVKSAKLRVGQEKEFEVFQIIDGSGDDRQFRFVKDSEVLLAPTASGICFSFSVDSEDSPIGFKIEYEEALDWWEVTLLNNHGYRVGMFKEPEDEQEGWDESQRSSQER
jgi:hypothetical protein